MLLISLQYYKCTLYTCHIVRRKRVLPKLRLPWGKYLVILCVVAAGGVGGPIEAQEMQDVVYLKDGSIIRGTIVEQVPSESLLIETSDGSRFRYSMELIERMAKEPIPGQVPPSG